MPFRRNDLIAVLAITALGRLLYHLSGITFDDSTVVSYMQFIDTELLRHRLLESLLYYHANPPALNFLTGLAIKLFDERFGMAIAIVFHGMGFAMAACFFAVTLHTSRSRGIAYILTSILVFSPAFVLYENWLMYTFPAASLLIVSTYLLVRYVETGSRNWGFAFFACIAALALTRSLFHFAWILFIVGALIIVLRPRAKQILICAVLPALLVAGWYGKNAVLFGSFSASTWMGLGLSNITTLTVTKEELAPLVADGTLSKYALVSRYKDKQLLFPDLPESTHHIPVLHDKFKSSNDLNFNYAGLIDVSRLYAHDALQVAQHFPAEYVHAVGLSNRLFFSPSSMNQYFKVENRIAAAPFAMFYNPIFYGATLLPKTTEQPHFGYGGKNSVEVNTSVTMLVGVPFLVFLGVFRLAQFGLGKRNYEPVEAILLGFLLFNILYIYGLGTLLELGENYRYRFLQEPLTLILLAYFAGGFIRRVRGWQSATPETP